MLTCSQAHLLLRYGATPGTPRQGFPELGFHIATCCECRAIWEQASQPENTAAPSYNTTVLNATKTPYGNAAINCSDPQTLADAEVVDIDADVMPVSHAAGVDQIAIPVAYFDALPQDNPAESNVVKPITYRSLLQNANFRNLWISQSISTFGSYFTRVAVPIYVFSLTNSYTHLGFSFFSSLIAPLLFSLFAGALVDRLDRRRVMINTDVASSLVLLVLVLCTLLPLAIPVKLACIYVVSFVAALLREIYKPARVSLFADVVSERELLTANSLDGATTTLAEFLSYPLAAAALSLIGPTVAFGIDAASFLVSALFVGQVHVPTLVAKREQARNIWAEIKEGLTITVSLPPVRKVVLLSFIVPLLFSLYNVLLIPYTEEALGSTKEIGFPALEAAAAFGLLGGMLMLGRWGQRAQRMTLLALGIFGYGVATFLQGILPQFAPIFSLLNQSQAVWTPLLLAALPLAVVCGAANSLILASLRTVLQENTPRAALGRVYSVMSAAAGSGFALGALLTGFAQGRSAIMLSVLGIVLIALGIVCFWWLPQQRTHTFVWEPTQ